MKKILLILAIIFTLGFTNANAQTQLPMEGNQYISFGYTPFQSNVTSVSNGLNDSGLVSVSYGRYVTDNVSVEGQFGFNAVSSYTAFSVGGNAVYHLPVYFNLRPRLDAGLNFTGLNATGGTNQNTFGLHAGLGAEWFVNENISLTAGYRLNFTCILKPSPAQPNSEVRYRLGTGLATFGLNFNW